MTWFARHAPAVEAVAASVTALVAIAALIGVKLQLDEADRLQKAQSAREAYRAHLALAATLPDFAAPRDACALVASDQGGAYEAFVGHLTYAAEQMLAVSDGWQPTFLREYAPHRDYMCAPWGPVADTPEMDALFQAFRQQHCGAAASCD